MTSFGVMLLLIILLQNSETLAASSAKIQKIDCYPESSTPSSTDCQKRNCVYDRNPHNGDPACYYDLQKQGYRVRRQEGTGQGFRVHLEANSEGPFPGAMRKAVMEVQMLSAEVLRITLGHIGGSWDTGVGGLVLSDQFLQLATRLPSVKVYGLGENLHDSLRHPFSTTNTSSSSSSSSSDSTWPAFARDQPPSFSLSRYGYNHLGEMKNAVDTTRRYGIPQDVQFADIDCMDERRDFTLDGVNFADLGRYFEQLHDSGMRTIVILDPALISNNTDYEPYTRMSQADGFVKWPSDVTPPTGSVDPQGAILGYDMNEPANFGTNEERPFNWPESEKPYWSLQCPQNKWDDPPYRSKKFQCPLHPMKKVNLTDKNRLKRKYFIHESKRLSQGARDEAAYMHDSPGKQARLSDKTLCMTAVQGERGEYRHYDVHNLYGYSETTATLAAARAATGERSLVVTRSTFPGSGRYGGHWLGDNQSKWSDLRHSIIELCKRWMQLGAFYTFSRNHNTLGATMSREILETRYWLLPYLYTLFHQVHTEGGTVIRPLHHEFPMDAATHDIDRQFLWGPALLISPILEQGQTSLTYYAPAGVWYDFFSGRDFRGPRDVTVPVTPTSKPVLLVRGGYILPLQKPALNTELSRKNQLKLLVALNDHGTASGTLFWDDGVSIVKVKYNKVAEISTLTYSDLDIWGVEPHVHDVTIKGDNGPLDWQFEWDYDPVTKILKVFNVAAPLSESFIVSWRRADEKAVSRIDCWPERQGGVDLPNPSKCARRGCLYQPHEDPAVPDCFFPQHDYGYT
ncbi:maltase-glucoamylase-like [Babylonia areolata]|uniref:maltase-glucoamylase-like n=1 Tax=Babylonia areolata TaxID=304850 RepID=UPI003FD4DC1B